MLAHNFRSYPIHLPISLIVCQIPQANIRLSKIDRSARNPSLALSRPFPASADEESPLVLWDALAAVSVQLSTVDQIYLYPLYFPGSNISRANGNHPQLVEITTRSFTTSSAGSSGDTNRGSNLAGRKICASHCYCVIIVDSVPRSRLPAVVKGGCEPLVDIRESDSRPMAEHKEGGDVDT